MENDHGTVVALKHAVARSFGAAAQEILNMNKKEIVVILRNEVGELEEEIKTLQARCERMKRFVLDLKDEITGPVVHQVVPDSKFRKAIDRVFGEKPRLPKR
jgi:hypothetical protein